MDQPAEEFKTRTFKIPEGNMRMFEEKLNKLIKRSKKLNSDPICFRTINTLLVPIKEDGKETGGFETFFEIEVSGTAPKLEGWNFIGTIDHNRDDSGKVVNLLRSVPGKSIPHKYHDAGTNCDHCNKSIYRKDTFIVEKDGDVKQVGRSCLKDFLGHRSPEQVAAYAEWIMGLEEQLNNLEKDCDREYRIDPTYLRDEIFTWAATVVRERGFVSKSAVENGFPGITTSSVIHGNLNPSGILMQKGGREEFERLYKVTRIDEDEVTAKETIEWINNQKDGNSDFIFNLKQLVKLGQVKGKHFGFIAAAVNSYVKERDKIIYQKKQKEEIVNEPIGKIGERVTFEAEVINVRNYQGTSFNYYDSGVRSIYTMKTKDNKVVVWFSSPSKMKKGDMVTVTGTIEKAEIDEYAPFSGCLKTMIKRGKVKPN